MRSIGSCMPITPVDAYEAQWNGAAKTLVSPEWSCVIEDRDEEDMYIKVIRKEDLRML